MQQAMELANGNILWIFASLVIGIVIFQSIKFIQLSVKASGDAGMTKTEVNSALKTGAIAAIGPSFAIVIVAISLIAFLGDPLTLMRIGVIGSAPIESVGASFGAEAAGSSLGGENFSQTVFTAIVWTLCLGGMGWLLFTALATKSLGRIEKKLTSKGPKSKQMMSMVATAAMVAAFGNLASAEMIKGLAFVVVALTASATMVIASKMADKHQILWLREWSLGLAILVSLCVGYFVI
ncbi:DUF5058 family protein [Shouchella shacheensis]|uniref:DUF5058 family protein n=1 Tax=Shouchella shacheensis TaxID=1649580 RepID=UPI00073FB222|nr:DUF5058 family protein [Shouchella shacheensis]